MDDSFMRERRRAFSYFFDVTVLRTRTVHANYLYANASLVIFTIRPRNIF